MFAIRTSRIAGAALPVVALAITAALATPAAAQHLNASGRTAAVEKVIPTMIDARRLVEEGRWRDARDAYDAIIGDFRITGSYPKDALQELANLKYVMEDVRGAANTWEDLGGTAETFGDPATELIRLAETRGVDLIAMSTHGHRFLNDLVRGTTVSKVRHMVKIPVLLLRAQEPDA